MRRIVILLIILILMGCTQQKINEDEKVTMQLKWKHQAQFAGIYAAKEKGYYESENLAPVELLEFDFNDKWPIQKVQYKEAEFAITGADELVAAKSEGRADNVKAIAVIYKINPVALFSMKEDNILRPHDLVGKTVGIERGTDGEEINVGILYKAMLHRLDINRSLIDEKTIGYDATEIMEGEVDVSSGYLINEPNIVQLQGHDVNIILVADYGVNMYADVIIAHEDILRNRPDYVRRFLSATIEGWKFAISNEDTTIDYVMKYAQSGSREHQAYMLRKSIPLIYTGKSKIGYMESTEWENIQEILYEQEMIRKKSDLSGLFTNDYLP